MVDRLPLQPNATHRERTGDVGVVGNAKANVLHEVHPGNIHVEMALALVQPVDANSTGSIQRRKRAIDQESPYGRVRNADCVVELDVLLMHPGYRTTQSAFSVGAWDPSVSGPSSPNHVCRWPEIAAECDDSGHWIVEFTRLPAFPRPQESVVWPTIALGRRWIGCYQSMKIRRIASIVLALALLTAACTAIDSHDEPAGPAVTAGDDAAVLDVGLEGFDGSATTLADYAGSPVVVNFWASWCPSCVAELGAALQPAYEAVGHEVAFLGVNIQDEHEAAVRLAEETGVLFDLASDPNGDLYVAFGAIGMPFTALVDADGNVVARHNGPLTEAQLLDLIEGAFPA